MIFKVDSGIKGYWVLWEGLVLFKARLPLLAVP